MFSPFIVDATATLTKRLLRREVIWQAHREHYYQRIVQNGFGHRNTALASYGLMLLVGGSAVWSGQQDITMQHRVLMIWAGIYLILMIISDWKQKYYSDRG